MKIFYSVNEKKHPHLIFCMVATLIVHPRVIKTDKYLPGDIPNIPGDIIIIILTPEIGQGLGRILSFGARKPVQT